MCGLFTATSPYCSSIARLVLTSFAQIQVSSYLETHQLISATLAVHVNSKLQTPNRKHLPPLCVVSYNSNRVWAGSKQLLLLFVMT